MLTDTEIAEQARQLLTDELAGLVPPARLLARVRAAHARARRNRRLAAAALATVTAAGVTTAVVAAASPTAATRATAGGRGLAAAKAGARPARNAAAPGTQTIELDGYIIGLSSPVRLSASPCGPVTFRLSSASPRAGHEQAFAFHYALTDQPIPAGATRISDGHGPVYLQQTAAGYSIFLRLPAAWKESRTMIFSFSDGFTRNQVIELARSLTILGHPAQLRMLAAGPPAGCR
jgi:hypothetical protein